MSKKIFPPATIGIIGGGQLGMMSCVAAQKMGYKVAVWDPVENSPAFKFADKIINESFDSFVAAEEIAKISDVVTYEFENINYESLKFIETKKNVFPSSKVLFTTQHRKREKEFLSQNNFPIVKFNSVNSKIELSESILKIGLPVVVKTSTLGYDGKGQWIIKNENEIHNLIENFNSDNFEAVVEKFIDLEKEISIIIARNIFNQIQIFPPFENVHRNNILHTSKIPAKINYEVKQNAIKLATEIAIKLDLTGLLCIEMFLEKSGNLLVNELAPRPHNSGHLTMDGFNISQFEMLTRAICGLDLILPIANKPIAMVNLLGKHLEKLNFDELNKIHDVKIHLYGKTESRKNRKMGHVNVLGDSENELNEKIEKIKKLIGES